MPRPCWILWLSMVAIASCNHDAAMPIPDGGGGDDGGMCLPPGLRPTQRDAHDAVYLPSLGRILVFGGDAAPFNPMGMTPSMYLDEVWSYDCGCGTWAQLPIKGGPGKRGAYAATVDGKRNRMLIVGGRTNDAGYQVLNDVWAFDGAAWMKLAPTGAPPTPRQGHRVVYDAALDRVVLFGGNAGKLFGTAELGDTWELSFAGGSDGAWRQIMAAGPTPRQDMATALDGKHNLWILYGGAFDFATYSDETWAFDLTASTWRKLSVVGNRPSHRFWGELVADLAADRLVMFGGHDDGPIGLLNDTWSLKVPSDGGSGVWSNLLAGDSDLTVGGVDRASPERRGKQSVVVCGGSAWLFGGISDCGPLDDVWTLDLTTAKTWSNPWKAQVGETCARRARPNQTCPSDCGQPL